MIGASGPGRARSLASARDLIDGTEAEQLAGAAVGQFDPASAGGPGSSRFGAAESLVNPWGYVLLVEGALLFAASAVRRQPACRRPGRDAVHRRRAPRTGRPAARRARSRAARSGRRYGHASSPWRRSSRCSPRHARRGAAGRPAARSTSTRRPAPSAWPGASSEFTRYGLQRRNGLAFAAVPLARVDGPRAPRGTAGGRGRRLGVPVQRERHLGGRRPGRAGLRGGASGICPRRGSAAAGPAARRADQAWSRRSAAAAGPGTRRRCATRPRPGNSWTFSGKPNVPELRVAVGLASCATLPGPGQADVPPRSMRQLLLPVDPPVPGDRSQPNGRWRDAPIVPGFGSRPLPQRTGRRADLAVPHRAAERDQEKFRGVPTFRSGIPVPAADLHAFARGRAGREDPGPVPARMPGAELAERRTTNGQRAGRPFRSPRWACCTRWPPASGRRPCERRHRLRRGRAGTGA